MQTIKIPKNIKKKNNAEAVVTCSHLLVAVRKSREH
jgi:hypothetical protein